MTTAEIIKLRKKIPKMNMFEAELTYKKIETELNLRPTSNPKFDLKDHLYYMALIETFTMAYHRYNEDAHFQLSME